MKTRITELLGIKYPIILSGMNWATRPKLVAAVSNAGGLGILGAAAYTKDGLREAIEEIKSQTDKPFGVNLTLFFPGVSDLVEVVLKAKVPVINYALGRATEIIKAVHGYGGKVIATIALVRHASYAEKDGADAILVTGYEAAAHGAEVGGLVLIPAVAGMVKVPIIATGGFYNGRGLAAALTLGAEGIAMGTRFALTQESTAHERYKQDCLKATVEDTVYDERFDGVACRVLKNKGAEAVLKRRLPLVRGVASALRMKRELKLSTWDTIQAGLSMAKAQEITMSKLPLLAVGLSQFARGIEEGDEDTGLMLAGQDCGMIKDIPTCAEVIKQIVAEAETVLKATVAKFNK